MKNWEIGGLYSWIEGHFSERAGFVAVFYQWHIIIFTIVAFFYFLFSGVAHLFNIEALSNPGAIVIITAGLIWIATLLQARGVQAACFIAEPIRGMYAAAQMGLLANTFRKVNQFEVPLALIIAQAFFASTWILALATFMGNIAEQAVFSAIFAVGFLLLIAALPFWLYSRHNKAKHKTIVLPSLITAQNTQGILSSIAKFRTRYHIRPAPEDYLPFSWNKKVVREQGAKGTSEDTARQNSEKQQGASDIPPEQVLEPDEIEYTD